jgi:hypothetical protein
MAKAMKVMKSFIAFIQTPIEFKIHLDFTMPTSRCTMKLHMDFSELFTLSNWHCACTETDFWKKLTISVHGSRPEREDDDD